MNKDFRIIWIDDSPRWVESIKGEIELHIEECGFDAQIETYEDGHAIESSLHHADVSLVIVDDQLETKNGDELIAQIRTSGHFTEIVYYSKDGPPPKGDWDGVFRSSREDALERIKQVIDLTIHKLRDLGVFRGLLIAQSIDLEVQLEECILAWFDQKAPVIESRLINQMFFDFKKKSDMVMSITKEYLKTASGADKESMEAAREILKAFENDIIHKRNVLAHVRPVVNSEGKFHLKGDRSHMNFEFTDENVRDLREKLRLHSGNLKQILELL
ncbi:MAG: response regulator [Verrucomicrobiota bacterium]